MPPRYRSVPNLIDKDFMPAHYPFGTVVPTTERLHSVSKQPQKLLKQVTQYLQIVGKSVPTLFSVVDTLVTDVLLCKMFIEEHIHLNLQHNWKDTVCNCNLVPLLEYGNTPVNAVLDTVDTRKLTSTTYCETNNVSEKKFKQSTLLRTAKKLVFYPQPVT